MIINKELGNRIKEKRKSLGFSQRELSLRTTLSQPFLSQIENGGMEVSADTIWKLCTCLGVDTNWFGNEIYFNNNRIVKPLSLSIDEEQLISGWKKLNSDDKKIIFNLIDRLGKC